MKRKRLFNFEQETADKEKELQMITAFCVIQEKLSDEKLNIMENKFNLYKTKCESKGEKYLPWYLWFLKNIKISYEK